MRMRTIAATMRRRPSRARERVFYEFFAGGGLTRLGLGSAWRCLFANDIDPQKCAAYRENFGADALAEGDVAALTLEDLPRARADLAWASFPCQDLSLAGARGGLAAARSGTFFAFWRLMEALAADARAPHLIVIENVVGLLTSNGGRDFAGVAERMAAVGYCISAAVIDAQLFTPQSRSRLFIFGFGSNAIAPKGKARDDRTPAALLSAVDRLSPAARAQWVNLAVQPKLLRNMQLSEIIDWDANHWHAKAETKYLISLMSDGQRARLDAIVKSGARRVGAGFRRMRIKNGNSAQRFEARFDGLAGCLRTPAGGSSRQIVIAVDKGAVRTRLMTPREAARLMGLPEDYRLPDNANAALKLCGDGVCVPVAAWIGENILEPALGRSSAKADKAEAAAA